MTSARRTKHRPRPRQHGPEDPAKLDMAGVCRRLGFRSKASVYRAMNNWDDFPRPHRPLHSTGNLRWWAADIDMWQSRHFPRAFPQENGERA